MTPIARRRPGIPRAYGVAESDEGMLEWPVVAAAISGAPIYWVSTVSPGATPHLIPNWGAFVGDAAYIEGGDMTRWARNLTGGDGRVHIGVDHNGMQAMVRGIAGATDVDEATQTAIADNYDAKYPYRPTGNRFWRITPDHVLAWRTDTLEAFGTTPTQFDFGGS